MNMSQRVMLPIPDRQIKQFRSSFGEWIRDMAAGKKHSSGLAQDLSRGEEAIFGGPSASERSLLVDLANTRGLNATTQNLGGYLVGAELSDIQKSLRPFSSLLAAGAQTDQRQGNLAVPKEVTAPVAQFLHESDTCTESTQFFGSHSNSAPRIDAAKKNISD